MDVVGKSSEDENIRAKLIGLGEDSIQKSYYPELRSRFGELERFKLLLDQANDFIFLVESPSGLVTDANETAAISLGLEKHELIGRPFAQLLPADARPPLQALLERVGAEEGEGEVRARLSRADGSEIPVEMRLRYQRVQEALFAVIVARDISERIKGEEELRSLRALLSDIVNSMPSILVGLGPDGGIIKWNQEARRFTGVSEERALGARIEDVLPGLAGEKAGIERALTENKPFKVDKISWNDGERQGFADVTVYPLSGDSPSGVVIRVDDVTERVRLEEMMVQSEKMLTVGGLAAGMAHEINNPLAVILGNAQIIAARLSPDLPRNRTAAEDLGLSMEVMGAYLEKRAIMKMLASISESGARAAKIVENMLSFSRFSATRPTPVSIQNLLDKTAELAASDYDLKKKYYFKDIEVERRYDPETPLIQCDPGKLQQVFLNILKNGAHAMSEKTYQTGGPKFIFRVRPVDGLIRVEIEDNGAGMVERVRKRIFEPFFTTKEVGVGTGLGLSVSYFIIVESLGGALRAESEPGRGSVFIIDLPLACKHSGAVSPDAPGGQGAFGGGSSLPSAT